MEKLILSMAIALCYLAPAIAKAQIVNGVRLSEIRADYIELSEVKAAFSSKKFIQLEYGQKIDDIDQNAVIKDDEYKRLEFNSLLDGVNKMKSYGYELFQVYAIKTDSTTSRKYYVLKRK